MSEHKPDQSNPDVSFPEPDHGTGAVGAIFDVLEIANSVTEWVPLLGTVGNGALGLVEGGRAVYDAKQAKDAYARGDNETANKEMEAAEKRQGSMFGHFFNAIPLVGTARALM